MKRILPLAIVILIAAGAAAWWYGLPQQLGWLPGRAKEFALYGNVDIRQVSLGFRVDGRLAALAVDEGDMVRTGDVLGRLDAAPFEAAVASAERTALAEPVRSPDSGNVPAVVVTAGGVPDEVATHPAAEQQQRPGPGQPGLGPVHSVTQPRLRRTGNRLRCRPGAWLWVRREARWGRLLLLRLLYVRLPAVAALLVLLVAHARKCASRPCTHAGAMLDGCCETDSP